MAPSPRFISFLLLLTIFSKQIRAIESQFLSKVSATTATPSTTTINNNNVQDKTLPSKQEESFNKQELDPALIPDTQNSYGLYGQESSQFPTTTKLVNGANSNNNNKYYNGANSYNNDEKQGMRGTRYLENGKYYYDLNNENYYPNNNNNVVLTSNWKVLLCAMILIYMVK